MKIAILCDEVFEGQSVDELDNQNEALFAESILSKKNEVRQIKFSSDLQSVITALQSYQPELVFNLVESVCCSDSMSVVAVQLLEMLELPYTGNKSYAQFITANKALTKKILLEKNIPTPTSTYLPDTEFIVKANTAHASLGLDDSCVLSFESENAMKKVLRERSNATGTEWIAEQYVDGREFDCAFLDDFILPPAEVCFSKDFVGHRIRTYESKWNENPEFANATFNNYDIEPEIAEQLEELTLICKRDLSLEGYARIDYRMDKDGKLYVIDVNTNPCISPDSSFVSMIEKAGISLDEMFDKIVNCAKIYDDGIKK